MINYVVEEIKYKIPDILCKHKNSLLSSPGDEKPDDLPGLVSVLVADRKKLLPGEVDLYCCGRHSRGENVTETK